MKRFKQHIFSKPIEILCEYSTVSKSVLAIIKDKNVEVVKEYQMLDKVIGLLKVTNVGDNLDYKLNDLYPFIYTGKMNQYKPNKNIIPKDYAILTSNNNKAPFHSGNIRKAEDFLNKIIKEYKFVLAQDLVIDSHTLMKRVSYNI